MAEVQQHTPESILASFYAAEKRYMSDPTDAKFDDMVSNFSADLQVIQTPALPYPGVWKGVSGFRAWGEQMSALFDIVDVQDSKVFTNPNSPDQVISLGNLYLRARKSQKVLEGPMCQVIRVDCQAGVIKEIQPFYWDVQGLLDMLKP